MPCSYTQSRDGFIGPNRPGRELVKSHVFIDLQRRGFRLFHRHCVCHTPLEPVALEDFLLRQLDYAGNERTNNGYRQLILPDNRRVSQFAAV